MTWTTTFYPKIQMKSSADDPRGRSLYRAHHHYANSLAVGWPTPAIWRKSLSPCRPASQLRRNFPKRSSNSQRICIPSQLYEPLYQLLGVSIPLLKRVLDAPVHWLHQGWKHSPIICHWLLQTAMEQGEAPEQLQYFDNMCGATQQKLFLGKGRKLSKSFWKTFCHKTM